MNSVDPGSLLLQLGQQAAPAAGQSLTDQQILALAAKNPASSTQASSSDDGAQNAQIAASVTPQGSNRFSTWLKNAPAAAGGEMYRLFEGIQGKKLDPLTQAVLGQAEQASPGVATGTDILSTLPATMAAGEVLPGLGLGRLAASKTGLGAVQGGLQGLLTADPGQRVQQGALGAITGGVMPMAGRGVSKLATGLSRTPEAQTLLDQGINLPPGMLNSHGPASALEQAGTHLPFIGSRISNARAAVPAQVTERMVQDAAAPGTTITPGLGINDAVSELKNGYDSAYNSAVGGHHGSAVIMRTQGADIPLSQAFKSVVNTARPGLTAQARAGLGATLQDQLQEVINAARQSGKGLQLTDLQQFRSTLRTLGREAPEGTTQSAVRDFWQDAEDKVTQAIESQLPPKSAAALRAIDQNYGKFATVRNLAVSVKDRTPTVNDWSQAVKNSTPPNVYAAGGGWNRDLVNSAAKIVKPTVAHTGALGAGTIAPVAAAASAGVEGLMHPAALMAHLPLAVGAGGLLGGIYGAYSKSGMRALAGQTAAQQAVRRAAGAVPPKLAGLLGLLGQGAGVAGVGGLLQAPSQ